MGGAIDAGRTSTRLRFSNLRGERWTRLRCRGASRALRRTGRGRDARPDSTGADEPRWTPGPVRGASVRSGVAAGAPHLCCDRFRLRRPSAAAENDADGCQARRRERTRRRTRGTQAFLEAEPRGRKIDRRNGAIANLERYASGAKHRQPLRRAAPKSPPCPHTHPAAAQSPCAAPVSDEPRKQWLASASRAKR
jgi:hypothetical protein